MCNTGAQFYLIYMRMARKVKGTKENCRWNFFKDDAESGEGLCKVGQTKAKRVWECGRRSTPARSILYFGHRHYAPSPYQCYYLGQSNFPARDQVPRTHTCSHYNYCSDFQVSRGTWLGKSLLDICILSPFLVLIAKLVNCTLAFWHLKCRLILASP